MRSEEVRLAADLAEQLNWLHGQVAKRLAGPHVNPARVWSVQSSWSRRVEKLVRASGLSSRVRATLDAELGVLAGAVSDTVGSVAAGTPADRVRAAQGAVDAWRRGWNSRILRVAITETTRLLSERAMDSEPASRPGAWKRWVSRDDDRVRESHMIADGQTVPIQQPFRVGMGYMMYPGDPMGLPQETVGCRCELQIVSSRKG